MNKIINILPFRVNLKKQYTCKTANINAAVNSR